MTVTTNEFGQQNMWAKEPRMYVDPKDALETYWERAEKANGRWSHDGYGRWTYLIRHHW